MTAPPSRARDRRAVSAKPRLHDLFVGAVPEVLDDAKEAPVDEFSRLVRRVEDYLDADGAYRSAEHAHQGRRASVRAVGDEIVTTATDGVPQGAFIKEVFHAYEKAEFLNEDPANPRTVAQRRADALYAIFLAAARPAGGNVPVPTVNVIMDHLTFEAGLRAWVTGQPMHRDGDMRSYRCETVDGDPLTPQDAMAAAVIGHVRRVVYGADSTVIDMARRSRVFRGASREAVWLSRGRRCTWIGCIVHDTEIDHRQPWPQGGETNPANGEPACDRHNRWKHDHGYRTWRDDTGMWHTTRPDGTTVPNPT